MSISSPSNDISPKPAAPSNSSVSTVSGAESTAVAVARLLQAQSSSCTPHTNSIPTPSSHHISPPPASMAVDCSSGGATASANQVIPSSDAAGVPQETNSIIQDLALQQHMLQVKQQQMIQRQILEQQFQRNREMLQVEHERQLSLLLHQVEAQRQAKENAAAEQERVERIRLEALRQKSCKNQSAIASPEVKRHLQEFVKKRKEAAASMSNLKLVPATPNNMNSMGKCENSNEIDPGQNSSNVPTSVATTAHCAMLRKTASESNLLKMKHGKRSLRMSEERGGPYSRLISSGAANPSLGMSGREPSIPETSAISIINQSTAADHDSLHGSPSSNHSASSLSSMPGATGIPILGTKSNSVNPGTTRPPLVRDLSLTSAAEQFIGSSAPNSPKQHQSMLGSPHGGGTNIINRYQPIQNHPLAGDVRMPGMQTSVNPHHPASAMGGPGSLARFVGPSAIASAQACDIANSNSKSLPNIPTAIGRHLSGSKVGRRSPPAAHSGASNSSARSTPHHSAMLVRRSKSSAILPLRKHLIEKTLMEQKAMDEEQAAQKAANERLSLIRPIEEVMEEDNNTRQQLTSTMSPTGLPSSPSIDPSARRECISDGLTSSITDSSMDVDDDQPSQEQQPQRTAHAFAARLGHAGLSPLVFGDVANPSQEYLSMLFAPNNTLNNQGHNIQQASALVAAAAAIQEQQRTGLGFDHIMLKHQCECENDEVHPENPSRVGVIWEHLNQCGLADLCLKVSRVATLEEIRSIHSHSHTIFYGSDASTAATSANSSENSPSAVPITPAAAASVRRSKFSLLKCGGVGVDADTFWNELHTSNASRTAVGTVIELSTKVAIGELRNGFALVRPPGHHAEQEEAMGFCYFNSVAIAAKRLLSSQLARRVLIVDWAIHHGNGTQQAFYDTPDVLYISLHRYDNGNFYPGTGGPAECGHGSGTGFNVNIAWTGGLEPPMADAEYLAAFRSVVMPVARAFDPDIVLVSAGFDAAYGHPHPIGGYQVSTACFAYLTLQLKQLARGKVVLALEGGYDLEVLQTAGEQCLRALLGLPIDKISEVELARRPNQPAMETLQKTLAIHGPYWDVLRQRPESALLSHLEAWEKERSSSVDGASGSSIVGSSGSSIVVTPGSSNEVVGALTAMASLSMKHRSHHPHHAHSLTTSTSGSEDRESPEVPMPFNK